MQLGFYISLNHIASERCDLIIIEMNVNGCVYCDLKVMQNETT